MNTQILNKLKELKPVLKSKYGLEKFALFGSQSRSDYSKNSDIDIVIISMREKSFDTFMELRDFLKKEFQKEIDIGFFNSMSSYIKDSIKKEMIYV
jgi:predicted nucleotidyltransferase